MNYKKEWQIIGKCYQGRRMAIGASINKVCKKMGISRSVIKRLEDGQRIRRRNFVEKSYETALQCIEQERQIRNLSVVNSVLFDITDNKKENGEL